MEMEPQRGREEILGMGLEGGRKEGLETSGLKITTYNINGLRSRVSQHGSLLNLLDSLHSDIICFQETKLSRKDISTDLTMAEGYEAFFSCTRMSDRGRTGYSEEGITGLLGYSGTREILGSSTFLERLEDVTTDELLKIDSEGRCIVTDHGHFVLFNVYGPRAKSDDNERVQFKSLFYFVLQKRWEYYLSLGKRVFVVGDLNIAPATIDCCDADPDFEDDRFRKWLRALFVAQGGPFFDCFRQLNPDRQGAYTCWPQSVGGEEFNFGSRIDHIIIAGPCFHRDTCVDVHNIFKCHVEECDIMIQFQRGKLKNMPKWKGGRSIKLDGSDHAPVYIILQDVPNLPLHNVPFLAARYIPEVRGRQQTILSFINKRKHTVAIEHDVERSTSNREDLLNIGCCGHVGLRQKSGSSEPDGMHCEVDLSDNEKLHTNSEAQSQDLLLTQQFSNISESKKEDLSCGCSMPAGRKIKQMCSSQLSIRSFFQKSNTSLPSDGVAHEEFHMPEEKSDASCSTTDTVTFKETFIDENASVSAEESECDLKAYSQAEYGTIPCEKEKDKLAVTRWQIIQQKMQTTLPLCSGHGEPCVARFVKKAGPNVGRGFYVCARAKGPRSNSEANCGHFEWASSRRKTSRR